MIQQGAHICQDMFNGAGDMRAFYKILGVYPTSAVGDEILIRSHIAYHAGSVRAGQALVKVSRGHSYKVSLYGHTTRKQDWQIVRIKDYYDHRNGVIGLFSVAA